MICMRKRWKLKTVFIIVIRLYFLIIIYKRVKNPNKDHTVTLEEIFEALNNQIECQEIEGVLNPIIG
jgi:hypothetical protein